MELAMVAMLLRIGGQGTQGNYSRWHVAADRPECMAVMLVADRLKELTVAVMLMQADPRNLQWRSC